MQRRATRMIPENGFFPFMRRLLEAIDRNLHGFRSTPKQIQSLLRPPNLDSASRHAPTKPRRFFSNAARDAVDRSLAFRNNDQRAPGFLWAGGDSRPRSVGLLGESSVGAAAFA